MEEKKPLKGEYYYKRFSQNYHLVSHQRTHNGEKPFKFDQCDKRLLKIVILKNIREDTMGKSHITEYIVVNLFSEKLIIVYHNKTNTGETPFKFDPYDKSYAESIIL